MLVSSVCEREFHAMGQIRKPSDLETEYSTVVHGSKMGSVVLVSKHCRSKLNCWTL